MQRVLSQQQLDHSLRLFPEKWLSRIILCQQAGQSELLRRFTLLRLPRRFYILNVNQLRERSRLHQQHQFLRWGLLQVLQEHITGVGIVRRQDQCCTNPLRCRSRRPDQMRLERFDQARAAVSQGGSQRDRIRQCGNQQSIDARLSELPLLLPLESVETLAMNVVFW